jgi:hypothetical protein
MFLVKWYDQIRNEDIKNELGISPLHLNHIPREVNNFSINIQSQATWQGESQHKKLCACNKIT